MLSRTILAPRDILLDTAEAKRLALFFDDILLWQVDRNQVGNEDQEALYSDLAYLREKGVVKNLGVNLPNILHFGSENGETYSPFAEATKDTDIFIPVQAITSIPKTHSDEVIHDTDRIIRHLAKGMIRQDDGSPVVAHANPSNLDTVIAPPTAIELVLKNIPLPPENIPWEDLIQFRSESENISKLRALRIWLQKTASNPDSPQVMQMELEALIDDYKKYMDIQHQKHSRGVLSTVLSSAAAAVAQLETGNFSDALLAMLGVRGHKLALEEAEMSAPGREVAYLVKTGEFLGSS